MTMACRLGDGFGSINLLFSINRATHEPLWLLSLSNHPATG